jgi:hypothetical protein
MLLDVGSWIHFMRTPLSGLLKATGVFHDQGDTQWIVIRELLRGHNDTPFGRPNPRPAYRPPGGRPPGRIWWLGYY